MSSRNREKRSRTPSTEANSSFVKNMTSRVSGLLPATITKWFSSPSTSSANGSAPTADPTDSSTDDETLEPPPSKRTRFTSTGGNRFFAAQDVINTPTDVLEPSNPYSVVQSPPSRSTFRRDPNFASTPLASVDLTDGERVEDPNMFKHHTVSSVGPTVATKRKSLFDSEFNSEATKRACTRTSCNTMRNPNEPTFKASLLASPFYPGQTMYGGASASYINQANIKQRKNTIVNKSKAADNTISHSAKRVMDLLDQYSSPLQDARRISQYLSSSASGSSVSPLNSSGQSNKSASYKTQELYVPSLASILRLKQRGRLIDTTAAARQIIASHSSTSGYHEFIPTRKPIDPVQPGSEPQSSLTSKVKSRLTRPARRKSMDIDSEMPVPVSLPTAILQIDQDKLPKFSFDAPKTNASSVYTLTETSTKVTETKKVTKIIETPARKPDAVPTINPYTFALPVRISSDAVNHDSQLPKFTFGSPERKIETKSNENSIDPSCVVGTKESAVKSDWKCSDCWVANNADVDKCVCCGGQKPSDKEISKKCSMCKTADSQATGDKCVNCEKITMNNISKPLVSKPDEMSKWKCGDCWVSNDDAAEKCICCGASKPNKPAAKSATSESCGDWKCDDCWINNKSSVDKCAACGGAKPGAKTAKQNALTTPSKTSFKFGVSSVMPASDNTLQKIVKSQASKWECPNCLVRNEADKTICACCDSDKPGTVKEPEKKFNFGGNTSFKFGIDLKPQETPKPVETKTDENKLEAFSTEDKKEQSETNNNVLTKTSMFSFGVPAKMPEEQRDGGKKNEEKVVSAPKSDFSFGVPTSIATVPVAKPSETKVSEEEKPQEVPSVTLTLPKPKTVPAFTFGNPTAQTVPQEKPAAAPVTVLETKLENQEAPTNTPVLPTPPQPPQPATTAATKPPFSFGSIKPQANLFTPATTASSTPITFVASPPTPATTTVATFGASAPTLATTAVATFGASAATPATTAVATFGASAATPATTAVALQTFQTPTTTTTSTLAMFQNPAPATVTSSLFQKPETAVTTAAAPVSLFSFGSNSQSAATEKPKLFSFSTNKTESTPIFGAPTDSSSNKFTLSTGNALGSGNGLSGNTGGNGLTGNALGNTGLNTTTGLIPNPISNAQGGNGMSNSVTGGVLGSNSLSTNPLNSSSEAPSNALGSNLQTSISRGIFGSVMPKQSVWNSSGSNNNVNNPFGSNTPANLNSLPKPAAFSFGSSTSFNASGTTPAFGGAQTVPDVFGIGNQPSNQTSVFSPTPTSNVFGASASSAPAMFGNPSPAVPTFGASSPAMPTFETPRPAFNFSAQQQPNAVFGFGQQPQQTPGVYSFGGSGASPQVQFNMGSNPNTAMRRVRKAVRKNPPR